MTGSHRGGDVRRLISVVALGVAGFGAYLGLPVILGALAASGIVSEAQLGWIASVELLALMVGSLLVSGQLARRTWQLVLPSITVALIANLLTGLADDAAALFAARGFAGLGEGACFAVALARLPTFGDPSRNSSWFTAGVVLGGSVLLVALPAADQWFGVAGVFGVLGLMLLAAAAVAPWLPEALNAAVKDEVSPLPASMTRLVGAIMLAGAFFYSLANTSFWAYAERLGEAGGISTSQSSVALSVSNLLSAVVSLLAYRVGRRWGLFWPQILCFVGVGLLLMTWSMNDGLGPYWIRTLIYFQGLTIAVVLQLSVIAWIDRSGRLGALLPAMQGIGQAGGPALGAYALSVGHGYGLKLMGEGVVLTAAGLAALGAYRLMKRVDPTLVRPEASHDAAVVLTEA